MIRQLLQTDIADFPHLAGIAWRWWLSQIRLILPTWYFRRRPSIRSILIDLADHRLTVTGDVNQASRLLFQGHPDQANISRLRAQLLSMPSSAVVLRLPAHEISRQTITLPAAARHRLRQVLAFELNRLSPIDPQKVQFTYRIIPGNLRKDYLAIDLWIIRKSTVERAIAICRDLALRPWELQQAGTDDAIDARDLFPRYAVFPRAKRNDAIAAMLCGAALVLAAGIAITIHQRNEQALATLQRQAAQAKADADRIIKLRNELTQRLSRASFLGQQKAKPSASAILAEITRLLPDDIWIAQFELVGAEIRLRGYAPKAAALIALIEKSPLFEKPQFKAPIVRAPNGDSERFDLSFVVKAGAS